MKTSDKIDQIIPALCEVHKALKNPPATKENPFYKSMYTPLDDLIDHIKPLLNDNSMVVTQSPEYSDGMTIVITRLFHSSGQWIETETAVPIGVDAQKAGASITYARRYGLSALFSVSSEDDNDANETTNKDKPAGDKKEYSGSSKWPSFDKIKEKLSNMNIAEINQYSKELNAAYNWSDKQKPHLKKMFDVARATINQDPELQADFNDLPGLE